MIDKKTAQKMKEAGVDPSVILDLMFDEEDEQKPAAAAPDPEPVPSQKKPEQPAAETKPAVGNDAILAAIEKLTGVIQASNIRSAGTDSAPETADTILASLIAPPTK